MQQTPTEQILIVLGALVVFSYIFDLFAKKARVPSVLLLLALGIGLRVLADRSGWLPFQPGSILPTIGTVGLILIVLDGALELEYHREKRGVIIRALISALVGLVVTGAAFTYLLQLYTGQPLHVCMANAVPFSVISSAVAIPSTSGLSAKSREFVIYESSLSDILGVIAFNIVATGNALEMDSLGGAMFDLLLVILIGLASCGLLFWIMARSAHNVRIFLVLSVLMMIYGIAKYFHLSSLIIVLIFGLFIANLDLIKWPWFKLIVESPKASEDRKLLHSLTMESTFLVRTFFFILFGFSITIGSLLNVEMLAIAAIGLAVVYIIRTLLLFGIERQVNQALLVLAPRGLITVLLFLSMPDSLRIPEVNQPLVVATVLGTAIVMAFILPGYRRG